MRALLLRYLARRPGAQLRSDEDEPDRLTQPNDSHAMDVKPQVRHANSKNDQRRNDATVDGDSTTESSIPQGGGGPENNRERGSHGINPTEGLIDLKNAVDHDLPLVRGGRNIAGHVPHNTWDDESADRRSHEHGDAGEAEGDDCSEGNPVGRGDGSRQAASAQEQQEDAHHSNRVRGTRDNREMLHLFGRQRAPCRRVDSHSENAAQRTDYENNSRFAIVRHDRHSRHESLTC